MCGGTVLTGYICATPLHITASFEIWISPGSSSSQCIVSRSGVYFLWIETVMSQYVFSLLLLVGYVSQMVQLQDRRFSISLHL